MKPHYPPFSRRSAPVMNLWKWVHQPVANCVCVLFGAERAVYSCSSQKTEMRMNQNSLSDGWWTKTMCWKGIKCWESGDDSRMNTCVLCPNQLQSSPVYTRGVFLGFGVSLDDRQPGIKQPTLQLIAEPLYHLSYETGAFCHMMTGGRHMHELDICFSLHYMQSACSTRHELASHFKAPQPVNHRARGHESHS